MGDEKQDTNILSKEIHHFGVLINDVPITGIHGYLYGGKEGLLPTRVPRLGAQGIPVHTASLLPPWKPTSGA